MARRRIVPITEPFLTKLFSHQTHDLDWLILYININHKKYQYINININDEKSTPVWAICLFKFLGYALWSRAIENRNKSLLSIGPLTSPFARSLALLTHLLAPPCLLRAHTLRCNFCFVHSFAHSLTHSLRSLWESE